MNNGNLVTIPGNLLTTQSISVDTITANVIVANLYQDPNGNIIDSNYGNSDVAAFLPLYGGNATFNYITGTLVTPTQPYVTQVGVLTDVEVVNTIRGHGNMVLANSITIEHGNLNLTDGALGNIYTEANIVAKEQIYSGANIVAQDWLVGNGLVINNAIYTTQIFTDGYNYANGEPFIGSGNANITPQQLEPIVANVLPIYTGNITADTIVTSGNITAPYFFGNGYYLTGITSGSSSYGNSNVSVYLSSGNITTDIITTANVSANNITASSTIIASGNIRGSNFNTTGQVVATGNVSGGNINTTGNVTAASFNYANGTPIISSTGNLTVNNVSLTTVTASGNITTTANVTSNVSISNTAIVNGNLTSNTSISNTAIVSGNLTAGNVTTNVITANSIVATLPLDLANTGNAVYFNPLTNVLTYAPAAAGDNYGNANVSNYLASGTNTANIITTANVNAFAFNTNSLGLVGNTINSTTNIIVDPLGDASPLTGNVTVLGNLAVTGNITVTNIDSSYTDNLLWISAANTTTPLAASGGGLAVGNTTTPYATFTYNGVDNVWTTNLPLTVNGNVTGTYFLGNGSQLTGMYGNTQVSNYLASGTDTANIITTGNITGSYFFGNISQATGFPTLDNYSNANVGAYLSTGISSNIITTANVSATYFLGNGSQLTGLPATYGNSNVATYLSTGISSNIITTANVSGTYFLGNGAFLTGLPTGNSNATIIQNGTSNVSIPSANGAINFNVGGSSAGYIVGNGTVALGSFAGQNAQGANSIALGWNAGGDGQGQFSVAIGQFAGNSSQNTQAIAIGPSAASSNQGAYAVAIGTNAGNNTQGSGGIAIGRFAGNSSQGANSIAIGAYAGFASQTGNSIVLNASGANLSPRNSGFYVNPVRNDTGNVANVVYFNASTNELTYAPAGAANYGNSNVATYLASGTNTSNIITTGNISGTYFLGNVSQATGFPTLDNYSNTNVSAYLSTGISSNIITTANISASFVSATSNGTGKNFQVGDDVWIGDVNLSDTMRVMGQQNNNNAYIIFGNADNVTLGRAGNGALTYGAAFTTVGNITAPYYYGNGAFLTGITAGNVSGGTYIQNGTSNVSIPTSGGNIVFGVNNQPAGNISSGAMAIGYQSGIGQGTNSTAIGRLAGSSNQGVAAVAFGASAGETNQGTWSVALGSAAGSISQEGNAVAIGGLAGYNTQYEFAVAVGYNAGSSSQQEGATAIGAYAGQTTQGGNATAVGYNSGTNQQQFNAVAVGVSAGATTQRANATAIGAYAGLTDQGANSVAVGAYAGLSNQAGNTIIINATGANLSGVLAQTDSFYVAPVRNDTGNTTNTLYYNTSTNEITYGPGGGGGYGNTQVANYLASGTFTGNIYSSTTATPFALQNYKEPVYALTYASTLTPDPVNGSIQTVTLTGNVTINGLAAGAPAGTNTTLILTQDATGNRILSSTMKFAGAYKTLSTAANAIDIMSIFYDGTNYYATLNTGYA